MHPVDEACSVNGIYTSSTVPTHRTQTGYNPSSNQNFNVRSEITRNRSVSETASPRLDVRNSAINEVSLSASNSTGYGNQRYENSGGRNISNNIPIRCVRSSTNFVTEAITQPHSEAGNVSVSPETKATASKPRVSFDEDSNTTEYTVDVPQNYEDVVTLRIPSKETSRFSCRRSHQNWKRSSLRWFHKTYHTAASPNPARWSWLHGKSDRNRQPGDEMEAKPNGNHLKSIYENENEERRSDFEDKFSDETTNLDPNRGPVSPKSDFYRICTGHDWEANQGAKSGDDSDNNNNNKNSMVWTTNFLAALSIFLIILTFPFSLIYCIRIVAEYERAVVLRMGNLIPKGKGTKGPGLFFILPCIDSVRKVDLRTITFAIPPQELLTRDSVTVSVDAVVYYRVLNPVASVLNIEDAARSTRLLAQTTIRNVLGTKDLAQILMDRDEISILMQSNLDATTDAWGVKVERVEIKDVRLPIQLQRAMAAEAEAAREARAKVIAATGEQQAARSLKKAARVIATSPMAFQLRYLQTLCTIAAEKNSTIFFPVPIDIMQNLGDFSGRGGYKSNNTLRNVNGWMLNQVEPIKSLDNSHLHVDKCSGAEIGQPQTKEKFTGNVNAPTDSAKQDPFWAPDDTDEHSDTV